MVRNKKGLWIFLMVFMMGLVYGNFGALETGAAAASEPETSTAETLQMISDAFLESYGEKYRPDQIYKTGTARYELQSLEQIETEIPSKEQAVEESVPYTAVEQAEQLPETYHASVKDQDTGVETEAELPVKDVEFTNWRWEDGFSLPITVQQYDADAYYLGNQIVQAHEDDPFVAYGKELLKLAGLSPKYYKITSTKWDGEPWLGEDGYWYRKAEAEGEKYVADCVVTYGDVVTLPSKLGYAWKAIYQKTPEIVIGPTDEPQEEQQENQKESFWKKLTRQILKITIALFPIILLLLLLFWLIHRKTCKKKQSSVH